MFIEMNCKNLLFASGNEPKMAEEICQHGFGVVLVEGLALEFEEDGISDQ